MQDETPEALQVLAAPRTPLTCHTAGSPLPRKRITKKTTCQHVPHGGLLHELPTCTPQSTDTGSTTPTSASPEAANVHGVFMSRLRDVWVRERMAAEGNVADHKDPNSSKFTVRRARARRDWKKTSKEQKSEVLASLLSSTQLPHGLARYGQELQKEWATGNEHGEISEKLRTYKGSGTMMTYQGPWSCIEHAAASDKLQGVSYDELGKYQKQLLTQELCGMMRESKQCQSLWSRFQEHVNGVRQKYALKRSSCAMELNMETTVQTGVPHIHFHWMFDCLGQTVKITNNRLSFESVLPYKSTESARARGRSCKKAFDQGHYYLMVPKVSGVFRLATHQANKEYPVSAEWVTSLWQQDKITAEVAMAQYIETKRHVQKYLENLQYQERAYKNLELQRQKDLVTAQLAQKLLKPKIIPAVQQHFLPQFQSAQFRRKFLILDGPSRMGKTLYASQLHGPKCTLEVNCANTLEPDLRTYDPTVHKTILFDEGSSQMVLRHKKLFQGPHCDVAMASSNTNCYSYNVWVYGCYLVITSNRWKTEVEQLPRCDSDWLEANSVYVYVSEPLY